jgi:hypothetical protein
VAQSWALWHILNKISIENLFPKQPADCVFKSIIFLQQWHQLIRIKDLEAVELLVGLLRKLYQDTHVVTTPTIQAQSGDH